MLLHATVSKDGRKHRLVSILRDALRPPGASAMPSYETELGGVWHGGDLDGATEVFQPGDETADLAALGAAVEVVGAEVVIERSMFEHVVDGRENGGGDRANRFLRSTAGFEAQELRLQVAALFANRGPGALNQQ